MVQYWLVTCPQQREHMRTSFPMELFLLMGENYVGNDAVGKECQSKRKRFDLALEKAGMGETRRKFYRALSNAGLG